VNEKQLKPEDKPTCFVVGPFGQQDSQTRVWSDCLCEDILKLAIGDRFVVKRTLDDKKAGNIMDQVHEALGSADIVVADLSDCNANAFYELGYRHGRRLPFVLVCREGTEIPFNLVNYQVNAIDAEYDERRRRYLVSEPARVIADLRSQVDEAMRNKPAVPEVLQDGQYRVRVFTWSTSYAIGIATDWLAAQDEPTRHMIEDYERGVNKANDQRLRICLAEYLSLKGAASKLWVGDVLYFLHSSSRDLALGYAAYQFPTGPMVIPLTGTEPRDGPAEITFDQPERAVSIGDLQVTLPRYKFTVSFRRNGNGTLKGDILHPTTNTLVGTAELAPKWGFRPDN
jgi:hypothetical protein